MYPICVLIFLVPVTSGLIFQQPVLTDMGSLADALETIPLSVQLDVGAVESSSRLNVNALVFELSSPTADYAHPPLPGVNGPRSHHSSGARTLKVNQEGYYIDMKGMQHVKTLDGSWEMVWKDDSDEGKLICGFDIPMEYKRNDASIPKCHLYLSFPLWTKSSREHATFRREKIIRQAEKLDSDHQKELKKMKATTNPFLKALHYRNAAAALVEKNQVNPIKSLNNVPSENELVSLGNNLVLSKKGLVLSRKSNLNFNSNILIGTCSCKCTSDGEK